MSDFGADATVGGGYEFNADEEQIIGRTARYAWLWGVVSIVIGTFALLSSLQGSAAVLGQIPMGIANIVIGSFFVGTSRSLKAVVTTSGDDIAHLLEALRKLGVAFLIQLIMFFLAFVAALIIGSAAGGQASVV
jgi:hypothetical protein